MLAEEQRVEPAGPVVGARRHHHTVAPPGSRRRRRLRGKAERSSEDQTHGTAARTRQPVHTASSASGGYVTEIAWACAVAGSPTGRL